MESAVIHSRYKSDVWIFVLDWDYSLTGQLPQMESSNFTWWSTTAVLRAGKQIVSGTSDRGVLFHRSQTHCRYTAITPGQFFFIGNPTHGTYGATYKIRTAVAALFPTACHQKGLGLDCGCLVHWTLLLSWFEVLMHFLQQAALFQ